jgi:Family of unknown function (DUF6167)
MRRLFWLAVGAGVSGIAARRANRLARAVTPDGLAERLAVASASAREFAGEVRAGMLERELELREALGLDGDGAAAGGGTDETTGKKRGVF